MRKNRLLVTCPRGLHVCLKNEMTALGFPVVAEHTAGIETAGDPEDAMGLNLFLRTGHRVLLLLQEFRAATPADLYQAVRDIGWEQHLTPDGYLTVTSSVDTASITDSRYANQKCKDAIVDRFMDRYGRRPDSGPQRRGAVIHLYWKDDACRLFLDTSGEPLSKRNYRKIPGRAPLQETLAAAVIMTAGWDGSGHFINPMCGSGTLAIEAALLGLNRPPGLRREYFGFMHLKGFAGDRWERLRNEAGDSIKASLGQARIIASDSRSEAIEEAKKNAAAAGVDSVIEFSVCDFRNTPVPEGGGIVMLNPEYGERMGERSRLAETYEQIGDFFKQKCQGYTAYVFTGNPDLAKKIGLRTKRRVPFYNSTIECRLLEYELYEGTRKKRPVHG